MHSLALAGAHATSSEELGVDKEALLMTIFSITLRMQLVNTMREILTRRDWWHLPRFVYGSSRGGAMALIMAQRFPFQVRLRQPGPRHCVMHALCTLNAPMPSIFDGPEHHRQQSMM